MQGISHSREQLAAEVLDHNNQLVGEQRHHFVKVQMEHLACALQEGYPSVCAHTSCPLSLPVPLTTGKKVCVTFNPYFKTFIHNYN